MTIPPNPHPEQVEAAARLREAVRLIRKNGGTDMRPSLQDADDIELILASLANRPADDGGRIAVLEGALRPFADIASAVDHTDKRDGNVVHRQSKAGGGYMELTKDDFRRAAAAIPPQPDGVKRP